jgi:hypothetical protein
VRFFVEQRRAEDAFPAPDLFSQIGFARAAARSAERLEPLLAALTAPPDLTYTFAEFVRNEGKLREARAGIAESLETTGEEGAAGDAFAAAIAARRPLAETMHADTCDGKLPPEERRAVVDALRTFETTADSEAACGDLATPGFLQTRWFDLADPLEGCITSRQHNAEGLGLPEDIVVAEVTGSDGIAATVHYSLVGGCECGEDAVARLHAVDGRWLVSALGY